MAGEPNFSKGLVVSIVYECYMNKKKITLKY